MKTSNRKHFLNVTIEQGPPVDGSVAILCCNLKVDGDLTGDIMMLTGNIDIGSYAEVDGDVKILNGNRQFCLYTNESSSPVYLWVESLQ